MRSTWARFTWIDERHAENQAEPDFDWFQFRFFHDEGTFKKSAALARCVSYVPSGQYSKQFRGTALLEIKRTSLITATEALLERKLFELPTFFDQIGQSYAPLDMIIELLQFAASGLRPSEKFDLVDVDHFLSKVLRLIILYWPSTDSDEIGLSPKIRPPAALRQAVAYIVSRQGFVENAGDVASNSDSGLRTLEVLFSKWLGVGIARYAKMTRMRMLLMDIAKADMSFPVLAKRYGFSNVTRLRREIEAFDLQTAENLEPSNFYSRLRAAC